MREARLRMLAHCEHDCTGHDIYHLERVAGISAQLAVYEQADSQLSLLGAWLHDSADPKFCRDPTASRQEILDWIRTDAGRDVAEYIAEVMDTHSWTAYQAGIRAESLEAKIVSDADKLDAMGAIGVARAFATGAVLGRPIHNPEAPSEGTIGHFKEKLLLLKDALYTESAVTMASRRHAYLQRFLEQFNHEWYVNQ